MSLADYRFAFLVAAMSVGIVACGSDSKPPAHSPGKCLEKGARVGVAGAKTGITTGAAGVVQLGRSVGGFATGGPEGAKREWNDGKAETKRTGSEGHEEIRQESRSTECP